MRSFRKFHFTIFFRPIDGCFMAEWKHQQNEKHRGNDSRAFCCSHAKISIQQRCWTLKNIEGWTDNRLRWTHAQRIREAFHGERAAATREKEQNSAAFPYLLFLVFGFAIELETLTVSVVNKTRLLLVSNPEQRPSKNLIHIFFSVFLNTWSESREKRTLFVYRKKVQ